MPFSSRLLAALVAIAILVCLRSASANSFIPSHRPLTPTERLDYGIGISDAVLLGRVIAQEDWSAEVLPLQWFKGGEGTSPTWIGFDRTMRGFESQKDWNHFHGQAVLFFLARLTPGKHGHGYPERDSWAVIEGPHLLGGGAQLYDSAWVQSVERELSQAVQRLSPDSIASRSDLVVIGQDRRDTTITRTVYGERSHVLLLRVEKTLLGFDPRSSVPMYSVVGGWKPGRAVFFLQAMPDSVYELVSFRAGQVAIVGDSVSTGGTLSDFEKRFKRLRKERSKRPR